MTLFELNPGEHASVVKVRGDGALRLRLLDMGLVPGTDVKMLRRAPAGDPVEIALRGFCLSLRRADAETVEIKMKADRGKHT